jgi:site-specific DNA recombinase
MKIIHRIYYPGLPNPLHQNLRVAAYCRVSTKHDEQQSSLTMQKVYYEAYIHRHQNWLFAGIYADQGTGRNIIKRIEFQQMMSECRKGKIDLILTKSITRFGRNTVDVLNCFRELKQLGIDVYFEVEKQYLSNPKSELLMTILTAVSQEESLQKSQNIRWGIKRSFENENSKYGNRICFGYRHDQNGKLIIDDVQAEIVKRIYCLRLNGFSLRQISRELVNRGIKSPRGFMFWGTETINKILANEKYTGNVLLQKTIVENYLTGKQKKNLGQENFYLNSDSHPAIIGQEMFNRVQYDKRFALHC